jgi:lysophospholipase L1-like esterase
MAYVKTTWQDGNTYGAESFNNIERGIENNDQRLTAIESGNIATIGLDRLETDLLNKFMVNLRTVPYDADNVDGTQLEICFMGDSVLFGYRHMDDPDSIEEDCITDDGDAYSIRFKKTPKRSAIRIHNGVINGLNAVYGANKVVPKLKLYSGYCAKWGYQHYYASKSDLIIINYGINDAIASWVEEGDGYMGDVVQYTKYMRMIVERELQNGTAVVLMTPTRQTMMFDHAGGANNDPNDTNDRTRIDAYEQALKQLAQEYGIPVIDGNELTRNMGMDGFIDFTHFTNDDNLSIGYRLAAYFIGQSPMYKHEVHSGDYLGVNPQIDNINITGLAQFARASYSPNPPAIMANANLTYPIPDTDWKTKGLMVNISGTGSVTWSFYAPIDGMVVIPSVRTTSEGQGVGMQLDFGGRQGKWNNMWNAGFLEAKVDYTYDEPSAVDIPNGFFTQIGEGMTYGLHMFADSDMKEDLPVLFVTTKGWHTVSMMMPATGQSTYSVPEVPVGDGNFDVFGLNILSLHDYKQLIK